MSGFAYHSIEKRLGDLLKTVRKRLCMHSLHDTFKLNDHIKEVNVGSKIILPFDVESQFTNVPFTETISFICKYIDDNGINIGLPKSCLKELLVQCTFSVQFS